MINDVIATMTTLPNRIDFIRPVINSILPQVHHLEINLPLICKRTGTPYVIPQWLKSMSRVTIFVCEDQGPITKILPTLKRHKKSYIFSIDDDTEYYDGMVKHCLLASAKNRVVSCSGINFKRKGGYEQVVEGNSHALEGFAGILYPPFDYSNFEYFDRVLINSNCILGDDVVLSNYCCMLGLELWKVNISIPKQLKFGLEDNLALHKQNNMEIRYRDIILFLNSEKLLYLPVFHVVHECLLNDYLLFHSFKTVISDKFISFLQNDG